MSSRTRATIVIVSHFCPFPVLHGNGRRLVAMLRWLRSNGYCVTYVLQALEVDKSGIPMLAAAVDRLKIVPAPFESVSFTRLLKRVTRRVAKTLRSRAIW